MSRLALVVEDEVDTGVLLVEILRRHGLQATHLTEGASALEWARQHHPEVILLDLMLPDGDGYNICEQLKSQRETNRCAVIIVTARHLPQDRLRGLQVGADEYLIKPFIPTQLTQAIDRTLARQAELVQHGTDGEVRFCAEPARSLHDLNAFRSALMLHTTLTSEICQRLTRFVQQLGEHAFAHSRQMRNEVILTYHIEHQRQHQNQLGRLFLILTDPKDSSSMFPDYPGDVSSEEVIPPREEEWEVCGLRAQDFDVALAQGLIDDLRHDPGRNAIRLVKDFSPRKESMYKL